MSKEETFIASICTTSLLGHKDLLSTLSSLALPGFPDFLLWPTSQTFNHFHYLFGDIFQVIHSSISAINYTFTEWNKFSSAFEKIQLVKAVRERVRRDWVEVNFRYIYKTLLTYLSLINRSVKGFKTLIQSPLFLQIYNWSHATKR